MSAVPVVGKVGALMSADENDPLVEGIRAEIRLIAHEEVLKFAFHLQEETVKRPISRGGFDATIVMLARAAYVREFHDA